MEPRLKRKKLLNAWRALGDAALGRSRLRARPLRLHLEINDYCNLKCFMCARYQKTAAANTGNLSLETVRALGPLLDHAQGVGLVGNGEPFLHPRLFDIIEAIAAHGCAPSVVTNGTVIKDRHLDDLVAVGPMLLFFSIDGGTKETFERIRLGASFDAVVDNLMAVSEKRRGAGSTFPILGFITCLMRDNLDELEQIVDLGRRAGIATLVFQELFPYLEEARDHLITDRQRCREKVQAARRLATQYGIEVRHAEMGRPHAPAEGENGRAPQRRFCENIWRQLHVELNGNVPICCFWTQEGGACGNVGQTDLTEIWNAPPLRDARRRLHGGDVPPDCQTCHQLQRRRPPALLRGDLRTLREIWRA